MIVVGVLRPMLKANKIFFAKLAELFVLWIVQIWCLQAYALVNNTKRRNRTTIYVFYIDMYKWKRNWAYSVVVYKIYHSYHVDQSSRLSGVTSFVERSLPPHHEKSNKNRKKRETNMSRVCLKEMHATIAFACVDSPSLIQRRASLSEGAIERCHSSMYNGDDKNGAQ